MIALWGVFAFLFYKVATAVILDQSLNLITSAIGGILVVVTIYYLAGWLAFIRVKAVARQLTQRGSNAPNGGLGYMPPELPIQLGAATLVAGWLMAFVMYLLIQGFDQSMADTIQLGGGRYSGAAQRAGWTFLVLMGLPIWVSGAISTFYLSTAGFRSRDEGDLTPPKPGDFRPQAREKPAKRPTPRRNDELFRMQPPPLRKPDDEQ